MTHFDLILQITGTVLGLIYLWMEYRADIRLWMVGLVMPIVHGILYFDKGLYADFSMQIYYILACIYGWLVWRGKSRKKDEQAPRKISHTPKSKYLQITGIYLLIHAAIYLFLEHATNSNVPFLDSFTTAMTIIGMWMLTQKYIEQWLIWIVVDIVTVGLYFYKELPITAGLYTVYTIIAFFGYFRWRRMAREGK